MLLLQFIIANSHWTVLLRIAVSYFADGTAINKVVKYAVVAAGYFGVKYIVVFHRTRCYCHTDSHNRKS